MPERTYEIRVRGLIPTERLVDELRAVDVAEHEMRTVLTAQFADQAALYGFLNLLRSYGLDVVEVRRSPTGGTSEDTSATPVGEQTEEEV
jgi:hypothetical protein